MSDFFDSIIKPQIFEGKAPLPDGFVAGGDVGTTEDAQNTPLFGELIEVNLKKGSIFNQE